MRHRRLAALCQSLLCALCLLVSPPAHTVGQTPQPQQQQQPSQSQPEGPQQQPKDDERKR